ncbi:hypothetical protein [Paracoccus cavernae]|uniref:hypothetical protein n=1 Tax=Paracoccus cavernae TaxID=1571207 RepID=UPI0035F2517B
MIGAGGANGRRYWLQATAISLALHGAAIAGVLYQPDLRALTRFEPPPEPEITIETLFPDTPAEGETGDPAAPEITPPAEVLTETQPEPEVLTPLPPTGAESQAQAQPPAQVQPESEASIVTLAADLPSVALPDLARELATATDAATGGEAGPVPEAPPAQSGSSDPVDPRFADLVARLRAQLQSACLLALPQLQDGTLSLTVLTANDREVAPFVAEVGSGMDAAPAGRPVLLDNRQCPGVTFLRRNASYPAFALPISLSAADIASGESATGRIEKGAGYYNTLLLVDDNGVVQDLRRFLTVQGGRVTFDVPMAREGSARDTNQLLIAIATPRPLQSVTQNAGRDAATFFAALDAELDDAARLGVVSLYIR